MALADAALSYPHDKRRRRTRAEVDALDAQILAVLREDHPQSVRHVFYRMTDPRLAEPVEKSERGYRHVQDRIVKLRRSGALPYGWISDATRRGHFTPTYGSAAEFLRAVQGHYRADLWAQTPWCVEVWTESRSIAGVVEADCRDLAVSLYPCGGFASLTLAYEAVEHITASYSSVQWVIFYIGDYDPAGVLIDVTLERELRKHLAAAKSDVALHFKRLGITSGQIREFELPTKPRKEGDKRARHVEATVEAEALPAHVLRGLLRDSVEALLPQQALAAARVAEASERGAINLAARALEQRT